MSTLVVQELRGPADANHVVQMPYNSGMIGGTGQVLQTVWRRYDQPGAFSAGFNSNTIITPLNLTITKKNSNSWCYIQWWLFYETHHNMVFRSYRDGSVLGYNTESGTSTWSGIGTAEYEHSFDNNSTPSVMHLCYWDRYVVSTPITYQIGIIGGGGSTYTVYMNTPTNTVATDNYERGVSWAMIQEISNF